MIFQKVKIVMYRLFLQWSENYVCGEAVNEELWEETILSAKLILKGEEQKAFKVNNIR